EAGGGHARADAIDDPRAVLMGNDPGEFDAPGQALSPLPVRWVNARGDNTDPYLTRPWRWVRHLTDVGHVGSTVTFVPYPSHGCTTFCTIGPRLSRALGSQHYAPSVIPRHADLSRS